MKTRIITALIGLPILGVILFFYDTVALNIALALVGAMAVYEMTYNTRLVTNKGLVLVSMLYALFVPFSQINAVEPYAKLVLMVYVVALVCILFARHNALSFQQVAVSFTVAMTIPFALSCLVFVRDLQPQNVKLGLGLYYIILILICAWISDAGAYFIGRAFGKHKMAPTISPKKTIEGAVGGVVFCVIFNIAFTYVYFEIMKSSGTVVEANLIYLTVISVVGSLVGILGDLTASIIKRQCGIKDFGNIMPGHGGIVDRFDSILFIAPFLYVGLQLLSVANVA